MNKGFGKKDLPLSPHYREYIQYAGTSGAMPEFDEETKTIKIIFSETPVFHKFTNHVPDDADFGTAKFAVVLQTPEQLRVLANQLMDCAKGFELLLDPTFEYREELMGRKPFDTEE